MFCPKCGAKVNDGAAFCGSCGSNLSQNNNGFNQNQNNGFVQSNNNIPQTNNVSNSVGTNKYAIMSLVFSCIAFFIFGYLCIAGIILGYKAKNEIAQTNEKGKGLATAGIVIGYVDLVFLIIGLVGSLS